MWQKDIARPVLFKEHLDGRASLIVHSATSLATVTAVVLAKSSIVPDQAPLQVKAFLSRVVLMRNPV